MQLSTELCDSDYKNVGSVSNTGEWEVILWD